MKKRAKNSEQERMEEVYAHVFDKLPGIWFRISGQGILLAVNKKAESIMGYSIGEMVGFPVIDFYQPEYLKEQMVWPIRGHLKRNQKFEIGLIHKKGHIIPCLCHLWVARDHTKGTVFFEGFAEDITDFRIEINRINQTNKVVVESNRQKDIFLAGMSHEIRTSLNSILGTINLFEKGSLNTVQKKQFETLEASSEALYDLLNDLLDISQIELGQMKLRCDDVSLKELMHKVKIVSAAMAKHSGMNMQFKIGKALDTYYQFDGPKIFRIFSNFITNAIKYSKADKIVISLDRELDDSNGQVMIRGEVKDNGVGIEPAKKNLLFQQFSQVGLDENEASGSGLGLWLSAELARLMGGTVGVDSQPGQGAAFWFTFSAKKSDFLKLPKVEDKEAVDFRGKGVKVLVVDDQKINLDVARGILVKAGCEVEVVNSGIKAMDSIGKKNYDLIFLDIQMPDIDGTETMKMMSEKQGAKLPPVIALTGLTPHEKFEYLRHGFSDYLPKPIEPHKLLDMVKSFVEKTLKPEDVEKKSLVEIEQNVPHLDGQVIRKLLKYGDENMIIEALDEFQNDFKIQMSEIEECTKKRNIHDILTKLHALKGNAGTLGLRKLELLFYFAERKLKMQGGENFTNQIETLNQNFNKLQNYIKGNLNKYLNG